MDGFRAIVLSVFCGAIYYALVTQIAANIAIGLPNRRKVKRNPESKGHTAAQAKNEKEV